MRTTAFGVIDSVILVVITGVVLSLAGCNPALGVRKRVPLDEGLRVERRELPCCLRCCEEALRRSAALQGRVVVNFLFYSDGSIGDVHDGGSDLADPLVVACVLRAVEGFAPLPVSGAMFVSFTVTFPQGAPARLQLITWRP